jgi:NitT/TauT family transport system substrate-binding protein
MAATHLSFVLAKRTPALMDTLNRVAQGAGFYADEELEIEQIRVGGAAEAAEMCSSGRGDICPIGIEPIYTGYAGGIRLKFFLARVVRYTYVLGVPDDSPIRTLADFRGATIGVHILGAGSAGKVAVDSMMAYAGLHEGDYALAAVGYEDDALAAVTSKRVAATAFPAYELIPFALAGHTLRVFPHPLLADICNAGYAASPATIASKADALGRFARAIVRAAIFAHTDPATAARHVLAASPEPFDAGDAERKAREIALWDALPGADPNDRRIGYVPLEGIDLYGKILAEHGLLAHVPPASELVTNEFVDFANDFAR